MALYGYARVSTVDQDCTLQEHALRAAGCEVIRAEKVSATRRKGRTELALLLEFLRRGDTLVVTRVDRLARSIKDLTGHCVSAQGTRRHPPRDRAADQYPECDGESLFGHVGSVRRI